MSRRNHPGACPWLTLFIVSMIASSGCAFREPTAEILDRVRQLPAPAGPFLRVRYDASIDSPRLTGTFQGVLVASTGRDAKVRLQLFPDIGGKVLDLVATPEGVDARVSGEEDLHCRFEDPLPRRLAVFLGITLHEHFATIWSGRVTGYRPAGAGVEIRLAPHPSGVETTVILDASNRVVERRFRHSWVRWAEFPGNPHRIAAPGCELTLKATDEESLPELPEALFHLAPRP